MRTLVYCTSYAERKSDWTHRQAWWIRALQSSTLRYDQLLIVDDGSSVLPEWDTIEIVRERDAPTPESVSSDAPILLYTHEDRLGRHNTFDFPGWHRSFAFGAIYAASHGFDRVIHLESDAHLISARLQYHLNHFSEGWAALWSTKYSFPEIAIQVAAGREVAAFAEWAKLPYSDLVHRVHERAMPHSHTELFFLGDRLGESGEVLVPPHWDFVSQSYRSEVPDYYWWATDTRHPTTPATLGWKVEIPAPFDDRDLEGGWCHAEGNIRWMIDRDSRYLLPPLELSGDAWLELDVQPCINPDVAPSQRLYVFVNDRLVTEVLLLRTATVGCRIPAGTLRRDATNCIRFLHPDGFAPTQIGIDDPRVLSVALRHIALTRD